MSCTSGNGDIVENETAVSTTLKELDINEKITENSNSDGKDLAKPNGKKYYYSAWERSMLF